MSIHGKMLGLTSALPKPIKVAIIKKGGDHQEDGGCPHEEEPKSQMQMVRHNLDDMKEALVKCFNALEAGDRREVLDCAEIIQSSAADVKELVSEKEASHEK